MMGIVLTETDAEIQAKINEAISYQINTSLRKNAVNIQSSCKSLAESWIISQPEIVSLQSGDPDSLAGLFGIPAGTIPGVVGSILAAIKDSVHVFFKPFDKDLNGNLEIRFQPSGFENLLSLPAGHLVYENGDLHWLNWLITRGSSIIIANYQYMAKAGAGRSGLGTMTIGGSFRVPPGFSGTLDDNFVTRALIGKKQESAIAQLLQGYL